MAIYIAVPLTPTSTSLNGAVESIVPEEDRYKLQADRGWLIRFRGTSVELSNHLGITSSDPESKKSIGSAIIVPVSYYYGRGPTEMWEWIKVKLELER